MRRFERLKRRDWKDPFSWFNWHQRTVASTRWNSENVVETRARLAEDDTPRLAENDVARLTEGY